MHIKTSDQEELKLGIGNYSCNWGTHMCGLYETKEERDDIIYSYLEQGLKDGDKLLYIHSEQTEEEFLHKFDQRCPHCMANANKDSLIDIKPAKDLYYPQNIFDPNYMDIAVENYYSYTQKEGNANLRTIAEMAWAINMIKGVEHLFVYESRLNYFVEKKNIMCLCLYNITKLNGEAIMNVLKTHPYTINGGIITQNPYYIHPDVWLATNAPQYVNVKN